MNRFVGFCIFLLSVSLGVAAQAPRFAVTKRYLVSGNGSFDYIVFDGSSNRLYVSHGTEVNVLDADSGKEIGKIEDTPGVHGITVVPRLHRGFITNGGNATVSVFDTDTFKTIKNISVPQGPDYVFYDSQTNRVFVCHGAAAEISAIDPDTESVTGKVDLGSGAEGAAVNAKGIGFVNLRESAMVATFDPRDLTVKHKWPITGCKTPTGLAMDDPNSRLFIVCRNKVLAVMDSNSGTVITTLPIGEKVDGVAFDSATRLIFASNGDDGTISVVRQKSANEYEALPDIETQKSAKTMAFDPKSQRIFLSGAEMQLTPASDGQGSSARPKPGTFTVLVVERQ